MKLSAAWTATPARAERSGGYRHFALLGQRGRGQERSVELQAVLDPGYRLLVPLGELRDRQAWQPGWQQLPQDQGPADGPVMAGPIPPNSLNSLNSTMAL
ncbi:MULTISPECIES: TIGR02450 family Trp-rich protein [unclassified Cyanobium]|uniref:TIGR02450 family Trp-rich protein n=1 Tax=unclassified Cyanobium TaxID=2627006 RepID=UPI0020CD6B46|nr:MULTISPECIES: TIGR02450 family Trp-rich protein [unclassified Cyanobium]MCP9832992.1 TIGR02450 family Trp-rich protein [Cyanobium sp. La Preciosa 7G6]MCP9935742.1 TIGR02450 family Trp-rich protein [Cyanobium sp. Aljojuca 7A6]